LRVLCALFFVATLVGSSLPANAQSGATLTGIVVDASSGVPLSGVSVTLDDSTITTKTDGAGHFTFASLATRTFRLHLTRTGYQPAISDPIVLHTSRPQAVTLSLVRASNDLHVITTTTTQASHTLSQSSTFTLPIDAESLQRDGVVRLADALRTLPGVNNGITGDTAALGDDVNLNIRGIGTLETVATLDGHPIGYGIKGGYNFQLSPVFPYRDVSVLYGSGGSSILGVNAIGGVVNLQTLEPTSTARTTFTQGVGSFERLASSLEMTGTRGKLGYALAYGTSGLDGPFRNATFYQPAASSDVSAPPGSAIYNRATYTDDSSVTSRAGLIKLRFTPDSKTIIQFTNVNQSYWENKTGNGDGDYLPVPTALARGNAQLQSYDATLHPKLVCPAGQFATANAYSVGGNLPGCQTPSQYAQLNAGWQGSGPAWQAFNFGYQDLDVRRDSGAGVIELDGFTTLYNDTSFRENLPYKVAPGDTDKESLSAVKSTGATMSDDFVGRTNDIAVGYSYLNNVYNYTTIKTTSLIQAYPVTTETAFFLRDVLANDHSPLSAYLNLWAKHASATGTDYLDPRLSLVDRVGRRDVVRVAYGATTTQPSSDEIGLPFVPSALADGTLQGAGGGQTYVCGALNSIGSAPSSILKPERGVDQEAAYAHGWGSDSLVQVQLYNVTVYDKLYSTIVPLSQSGTAFLNPSFIANATTALSGVCGAGNYSLGVTGTVNVGTLRARGADLSGRFRFARRTFADYDWALTSSALMNAPAPLLQSNLTDVIGAQIARVPLHTYDTSIDQTIGSQLDARFTLHGVSSNNTKALPAYTYSDLRLGSTTRDGTFTVTVSNVFNQYANIAGLIGEGVPLQLNGYATRANYAPLIGAAATEQYGLPYRQIYFSYQWRP
jgi:Carboxypeptidase regulatory-like domain/TonB-dependent Receptor Plug Domain